MGSPKRSIGERIKTLRIAKGLSQAAFTEAGISTGYISLIEKGLRNPSHKALEKISSVLNVPISEFSSSGIQPLSKADEATIKMVETAISLKNFEEAVRLLESFSQVAKSDTDIVLLNAEVDVMVGNFLSASITLEELIPEILLEGSIAQKQRVLGLFAEANSRTGAKHLAVKKLHQVREQVLATNDTDSLDYLDLILASRYSELGDFGSANQILYEVDDRQKSHELVKDIWRVQWAKSNVAYDAGDFLQAEDFAESALNVYRLEHDGEIYDRLLLTKLEATVENLKATSTELEEVLIELDMLSRPDQNENSDSNTLDLDNALIRVKVLSRLGRDEEAMAISKGIILTGLAPIDCQSEFLLILTKCQFALGNYSEFEETWRDTISFVSKLEASEPNKRVAQKLLELALTVNDIGKAQVAMEISKKLSSSEVYNKLGYLQY